MHGACRQSSTRPVINLEVIDPSAHGKPPLLIVGNWWVENSISITKEVIKTRHNHAVNAGRVKRLWCVVKMALIGFQKTFIECSFQMEISQAFDHISQKIYFEKCSSVFSICAMKVKGVQSRSIPNIQRNILLALLAKLASRW